MRNSGTIQTAGKHLRIISMITMAILVLATLWLIYDLYSFIMIRGMSPESEILGTVTGIGYLVRIVLFISFGILIFRAFRGGLKPGFTVMTSIIGWAIAIIAMFFDFAALEDIGTDYLEYGYSCTGEWIWLFGSLILRLGFYISMLLLIIRILKGATHFSLLSPIMFDEIIFEVTQWVGMVSGATGVAFTVYGYTVLDSFSASNWLLWLLLFYCGVIILPWLALTVCRISRLVLRKGSSPYDEKQKQDMAFSGMAAWLASIPLMAIILGISVGKSSSPVVYLWFPFYLFSTLLVYSAILLARYRRG
jgi:hypothetical protein